MMIRGLKIAALGTLAILCLTACDPPMPPEVKAALAEQSYTCESGVTQLASPAAIAAVAGDWQASVETNCPGMTISPVEKVTADVELQVSKTTPTTCKAYASVPFAVDAVVLASKLGDVTNVNLSAPVINEIFSGKITSWNDSKIAELNPNFTLPNLPIAFGSTIEQSDVESFNLWLANQGAGKINIAKAKLKLEAMSDGDLVLTNYSDAMALGLMMVGLVSDGAADGVVPEVGSIGSAASMFKSKISAGQVSLTFDAKAKPVAPEGVDVAPAPYQPVSVISLNLCGADSLKTRAAARYLLRQDSQGSLGLSNVAPLPESLRIIALEVVSKGLPEPKITAPTN